MQQLKPYVVPLIGLAVLGAWFLLFKPRLESGTETPPAPAPPAPPAGARVTALPAALQGGLDAGLVQTVIDGGRTALEACYEDALAARPGLRGRLVMQIQVRGDGSVRAATVAASQMSDPELGACFSRTIAGLSFPRDTQDRSTLVSLPFDLAPAAP
jgi:hypothetical protein